MKFGLSEGAGSLSLSGKRDELVDLLKSSSSCFPRADNKAIEIVQ